MQKFHVLDKQRTERWSLALKRAQAKCERRYNRTRHGQRAADDRMGCELALVPLAQVGMCRPP